MGFRVESIFTSAIILAIAAVIFSAESRPDPERVWHYWLFGLVFLNLTFYLPDLVLDSDPSDTWRGPGLMIGIPLAVAAWMLTRTSYSVLAWVTAGYALAFLVIAPGARWLVIRWRRRKNPGISPDGSPAPAEESHPLYRAGEIITIAVIAIGLILTLSLVAQKGGLSNGIFAVVVWPVTLLAVPWYALFEGQDWIPVAVVYGGGGIGWLLKRIGEKRSKS